MRSIGNRSGISRRSSTDPVETEGSLPLSKSLRERLPMSWVNTFGRHARVSYTSPEVLGMNCQFLLFRAGKQPRLTDHESSATNHHSADSSLLIICCRFLSLPRQTISSVPQQRWSSSPIKRIGDANWLISRKSLFAECFPPPATALASVRRADSPSPARAAERSRVERRPNVVFFNRRFCRNKMVCLSSSCRCGSGLT